MTDLHERKLLVDGVDFNLDGSLLTPISREAQDTVSRLLAAQVVPFIEGFCSPLPDGNVNFTNPSLMHLIDSTLNQHAPFIGG